MPDSAAAITEPKFASATANSLGAGYEPGNAIDGDPSSAWAVRGGVGESIMLAMEEPQLIEGLRFLNGYTKFNDSLGIWLYEANNRPEQITISFSDGTSIERTLDDVFSQIYGRYQEIKFPEPVFTSYVDIKIESVYPGEVYNDTCISEIQPYINYSPKSAPRDGKLWDDGIYALIPKGESRYVVYGNEGKPLAHFYHLDSTSVLLARQDSLFLCMDYYGAYNLFSFEGMSYVIDESFPVNSQPRMPWAESAIEYSLAGNRLTAIQDGSQASYTLPFEPGDYDYVSGINSEIVSISNEKLFLYKSGIDISHLLGHAYNSYANVRDEFVIIEENNKIGASTYSVIGLDGSVLWKQEASVALPYDYEYCDINISCDRASLTANDHGAIYTLELDEPLEAEYIYAGSANHQLATIYTYGADSKTLLLNYKTGEDLSSLLEGHLYIDLLRDYLIVVFADESYTNYSYSIYNRFGEPISSGPGSIGYLGNGLFHLKRGSYSGIADENGQWLVRSFSANGD
ncbi:MAG: discoidin domain-containing protein [Eubacteriaceae bacterium]|nr:discoidin domain-containing protein [Eubacteriaceae bacterium]